MRKQSSFLSIPDSNTIICQDRLGTDTRGTKDFCSFAGNAVVNWNMQQLFTDFLSFRGNRQRSLRGNFGTDEPEHLWLGGQAMAAQDLGCEVQFCMAAAHQLLMSLEWPAVTNARANGDGGLDLEALLCLLRAIHDMIRFVRTLQFPPVGSWIGIDSIYERLID